jgi:hypothetical protein
MTATEPAGRQVKVMRLRRDGVCGCGAAVPAGQRAGWNAATRAVVCPECLAAPATVPDPTPAPATIPDPAAAPGEAPPDAPPITGTPVVSGQAGASLQREYERRSSARESRIRRRHPRIGGLLLAVTSEPQSTVAFKIGAEGERRIAARLEKDSGEAVLFLHNRLLGAGRRDGDVDHIAIGPTGVYVIDAKHYSDKKVEVRRSGGLFSPVKEQLFVGGRDRTRLLDSLARQLVAVRTALDLFPGGGDVPVATVLCFLDAVLPMFGTPVIGGVPLLGPRGTARLVAADGRYDAETRAALHAHLAAHLPPAR